MVEEGQGELDDGFLEEFVVEGGQEEGEGKRGGFFNALTDDGAAGRGRREEEVKGRKMKRKKKKLRQ